ncbi:MAG: DUF1080 domain-containing protein [Phycisphaeraceae bacterium]|nr:DUF1080 domain-containing protein [Phycisphaeraceae bacterium]MCW5764242.1 DUF1080 domain-containing protein [Phycisphaeraceae bacterium]
MLTRILCLICLFAALPRTVPSAAARSSEPQRWVSLFDGRTLDGWRVVGSEQTKWDVVDGAIVGSGQPSMLVSTTGPYRNFRYRVEMKINDGGNSGLYFRTTPEPGFLDGYEAQVASTHTDPIRTGSLYGMCHVYARLVEPDAWFVYEIGVRDDVWRGRAMTRIRVSINGQELYEYLDFARQFGPGHFAFQQHDPKSIVSIRSIQVLRLPDEDGPIPQPVPEPEAIETEAALDVLTIQGSATITFDTTEVPELRAWVQETLMPVVSEWYPKITAQLASDGFSPPDDFRIIFRAQMDGVAHTSGQDIYCAGEWYKANLRTEAVGSVVHELVHVAQQYRGMPRGQRPPGWLVEGIADQIRWYQFEPVEKRRRLNWERANYDQPYFPAATFLDYIVRNIDRDAITTINADCRAGRYSDGYWLEKYGMTAEEIWAAAKAEATAKGNP